MAQVLIDQVVKIYPGDVTAVKGIDLHIKDAEFIVLVGPSGCGKSTTLRMVAGLEEITDGTIRIGERVVNDVPPKDRDIAMVFQNYALYPHMTVYKNLAFGLKLRKFEKAEIDRRVREAASILGIEELLDRKPKALSGGQRQRVAVGRAIVRDPACFLFDEPLSNLDAKLRVETRAELKRLHRRLQTTTVYVTHDQEEAMTLGDRVVVMSVGEIQQAAPPLTVYNQPSNRFVAAFVGTPPMNFIDGVLEDDDGVRYFVGQGVRIPLDDWFRRASEHAAGREVALGIRPDGLFLHPEEPGHTDKYIDVRIGVTEPLGSTMDLFTFTSEEHRIVARVEAETVEMDTNVTLYVDPSKMHLFDAGEYGKRLTAEAPTPADVA
jgi:multiple sugar transport system ATP-binding protein